MFMKNLKIEWKPLRPYLAAIGLFLLMSIVYVHPILDGRQLLQPDIVKFLGMSNEIADFREHTGEEALWTNSMFGGMPAFQISTLWKYNISDFFHNLFTLWLPHPADMIFLYFAGFFLFLVLLGLNPWLAFAGAVAFAFSSYHFIIIQAGHNSKAVAIAYMAPVLGSVIYAFRGKMLLGGILFALFMGLKIFANHYQITYYLGLIVLFYGIFEFAQHIKNGKALHFFKVIAVLVAGLIIALGLNFGKLWGTYTYAQETMRGGSELTIGEREATEGLSLDYITHWSYGKAETLTLLIPNTKGGATGNIAANPAALEVVDPQFREFVGQQNHYWGDQPFTSGPVYAGAVVMFLFVFALFFIKGPLKWGLLLAAILAVMLSWGRNFMPLTSFFVEFVPGYSSFRAVSMILVVVELIIPALAFLGMHQYLQNPRPISYRSKSFLTALGLTAGVGLLFYFVPRLLFNFISNIEADFFATQLELNPGAATQINQFLYNLEAARISIFRADALRSALFALATGGLLLLFASKKIPLNAFIGILVVLLLLDMWPISRRYLNDTHFEKARLVEQPFQPTRADLQIMQDTDLHFRVFNLTVNAFNESSTSYFHSSIGGYHGAKLQRYQDLIDFHLVNRSPNVLNMLNTKYLIVPGEDNQPVAQLNPDALGNAWLVADYRIVANADEEIQALTDFNPSSTALIDRRFAGYVEERTFSPDTLASISLMEYSPNRLRYQYQTSTQQIAVFSEVFYPNGWYVTLNGEPIEQFRVNYILRAIVLPAGSGEIVFEFRPAAYFTGRKVSFTFSALLLLLMIGYGYNEIRKKKTGPLGTKGK